MKVLRLILKLFESMIRNLSGPIGEKIRYYYYSKRLKYCGKNVVIKENVYIDNPEFISIGDNTLIDRNVILIAGKVDLEKFIYKKNKNKKFKLNEGELYIGKNVHIAPYCVIQAHGGVFFGDNGAMSSNAKIYSLINSPTNMYDLSDIVFFTNRNEKSSYFIAPVQIDENVGVGLNSVIIPGVFIEKNSFVAPNSIVMTNVKENSFVSGSPAKKIKNRFQDYKD